MLSKKSYALIDVREKTEYNSSQILGATNVPRRELEFRLSQLVPNKSTTIILYDNNDQRARLAAETLQRNGYTNIHVLKGGLIAWQEAGNPLVEGVNVPSKIFGEIFASRTELKEITPRELNEWQKRGEDLTIIEVRPPEEVEHSGSIPGAINIQGVELPLCIHDFLDQNKKIVITCAGRTRGFIATLTLKMMGIDVYDLQNGTQGWVLSGFQLQKNIPAGIKPSPKSRDKAKKFALQLKKENNINLITPKELIDLQQEKENIYLCDVRTKEEYVSGHIPGSLCIPGGQAIQCADDFIAVRYSPIIFICDDMTRSIITAYWYKQMQYKNVFVLEGGLNQWREMGGKLITGNNNSVPLGFEEASKKVVKINAFSLKNELDNQANIYLIYVGNSREFQKGHLPGSIWLNRSFLEEKIKKIVSKEDKIIVTCKDGKNSILATATLMDLGYQKVQVLEGGTEAWMLSGLPLESGTSGIQGKADDFLPRSHERTPGEMIEYLNWEINLHNDPLYTKILDY